MSVSSAHKGFTLIEIVITLTIAGLVLAFAVPGMQQFLANNRLSSAASAVPDMLMLAKSEAAIKRKTIVVRIVAATAVAPASLEVRQDTVSGTLIKSIELPTNITVTSVESGTSTAISNFQFNPMGLVQKAISPFAAVGVNIRLCESSIRNEVGRQVLVTQRGRLSLLKDTSAAICNP